MASLDSERVSLLSTVLCSNCCSRVAESCTADDDRAGDEGSDFFDDDDDDDVGNVNDEGDVDGVALNCAILFINSFSLLKCDNYKRRQIYFLSNK